MAQKRYDEVMALRPHLCHQPDITNVFDCLERHWPTLVNGIESTIIPRTNNTVELVIRRFDEHYQKQLRLRVVGQRTPFLGRLREGVPPHPLPRRRPAAYLV
jgi:hypothetical protein